MADFSVTIVDPSSGRTETLPLDPATPVREVVSFAQAIFDLDNATDNLQLLQNGKALDPSSTLQSSGVSNGDMLAVQAPPVARSRAPAPTGGGGLDFSNLLAQAPPASVAASTASSTATLTPRYYPGMSLDEAMHHNPHPRTFVSLLQSKEHLFKELRYHNPSLASMLEGKPLDRAVEIWKGEIVKGGIASAMKRTSEFHQREEMTKRLQTNPNDAEAREYFAGIERKKNVEEQYVHMMNEHPESMGRVLMLYIDAKINGHPIQAFCDSGAQMTIMSKKVAKECGVEGLIDTRFSGIAAGVGTGKILGRIHIVQLQIGNSYFPCSVSVMDDPVPGAKEMPFLLGLDMMKRHLCLLDLQSGKLKFPMAGIEAPFLHEKDLNQDQGGTQGFDAEKANLEVQEALMQQFEGNGEGKDDDADDKDAKMKE
jgi:DNA damage-inducible protein 1